jgi:polyketide synthase-associated protein
VIKAVQPAAASQEALDFLTGLEEYSGPMQRLPEELEELYLGKENRGKVVWWEHVANTASSPSEIIAKNDEFLSKLAALIQPYSLDMFGKNIDERTPTLLSVSLDDDTESDYPPAEATDKSLGDFLRIFQSRVVQAVYFMGPGTTSVELEATGESESMKLPFRSDSTSIVAGPGTILLFNPRAFRYAAANDGQVVSLTSSFTEGGDTCRIHAGSDDIHLNRCWSTDSRKVNTQNNHKT